MKNSLIETFFPRFCLGCGYLGVYICPTCEEKMKKISEDSCFYCNKPSLFGLTHPRCKKAEGLDGHTSIYFYGGVFKRVLHESKYKSAHQALKTLLSFPQKTAVRNIGKWNDLYNPTMTHVPLHPQRYRERGFNQSELIMNTLFPESIKMPLLNRVVNTPHLALIDNKNERKKQIRGAFRCNKKTLPKTIIIIDDVITSGSTILECVRELKENGVQTVLAFSLAKG